MLGKSAAKRQIDINTLAGRLENSEILDLKQSLKVMSVHASTTCTIARAFIEFFRFAFARFSPVHQRAATLPIFFHSHKLSSNKTDSDSPESAIDAASDPSQPPRHTSPLLPRLHLPLSLSPFASWIHNQRKNIHSWQSSVRANLLPRSLNVCSLYSSFLIRVYREKGRFQSRRAVGWTTLTYTLTRRHRAFALCLSSLFSVLALRLSTPSALQSHLFCARSLHPHFITPSSVTILRHLRSRCQSQV
jgi:hypothetical protein